MKIKTRNELASILTDGWKNELVVNINDISFLTDETKICFGKNTDKTLNNFIKIYTNDGSFICGIIITNIVSISTTQTYKVALC